MVVLALRGPSVPAGFFFNGQLTPPFVFYRFQRNGKWERVGWPLAADNQLSMLLGTLGSIL